jgi:hypothetical protein
VIQKGQTLVNPVTGERMTFVETAADTGGERVVIELRADPGGSVAAAHVHPSQWETFKVVSGTLGAKVAGRGGRAPARSGARRRARRGAHLVERRRRRARLPVRDPTRTPVRAADRDDVLARGRREDEQERDAEPLPPRGDRELPLRHGPAAGRSGLDAEGRAGDGRAGRQSDRLRPDVRAQARHLRRIPARAKRYGPGETIVRTGDPGNAFYVVLDGKVRVDPPKGASVTLEAGDSFGEMALLDGAPRSADISAVGEVTLMVIGRAGFTKLLRSEPQIAGTLLRTLAGRLRAAQEQY